MNLCSYSVELAHGKMPQEQVKKNNWSRSFKPTFFVNIIKFFFPDGKQHFPPEIAGNGLSLSSG